LILGRISYFSDSLIATLTAAAASKTADKWSARG